MEVQNMSEQIEKRLHSTASLLLDGDNFVVVQRSNEDSYNPGLWEFLGGKVENFVDLRKEGMREVHEELLGDYWIMNYGLVGEIRTPALKPKYKGFEITYYIFIGTINFPLTMSESNLHPGDEHQAYAILDIEKILKLDLTPEAKMIIEKIIKPPK